MATAKVEKLRERAAVAYDKLTEILDAEGHGPDCVLRCIEDVHHEGLKDGYVHECSAPDCAEDEAQEAP